MASSSMKALLVCFSVLLAAQLAMAAKSPPAPSPASTDCLTVALTLSDCLDYVEGTSSKPSSACCKEAAPVIANNPQCLCILFNKTLIGQLGLTINTTQALKLPTACKLTAPDPSLCTLLGYDVPGASSPSGSPASAPSPESGGATAPSSSSASVSSPSTSISQTATPSSSENNNSASPALPLISVYSTALLSVAAAAALAF